MNAQPQDSPGSSLSGSSQSSLAMLREIPELLLPVLEVVPLQLFAYHFAAMNGCDVDHPRHLVKAVVRE